LSRYLVENDIASMLGSHGVQMVVHTLITGGGNGINTLRGMKATIEHFAPGAQIMTVLHRSRRRHSDPCAVVA
jgi:hypothetical protein